MDVQEAVAEYWEGDPGSGGVRWGNSSASLPAQHWELGKVPEGAGRGHQEPWECRQPGLGQLKERSTRNIKLTHFSSMTGGGCRWAAKRTPGQSSICTGQLPSLLPVALLALGLCSGHWCGQGDQSLTWAGQLDLCVSFCPGPWQCCSTAWAGG